MTSRVIIQDVHKVYPNGTEAVKGVDLQLSEGEALGLVGPNGAGKTTLVKLILGLLRPTSGHVQVWGEEAYALSSASRRKIGFLPEEQGVYESLTVEENLLFWARLYGADPFRVDTLLREWDLEEKRGALVKELSAGMRQKLAMLKALLHDPPLLVLDEPTSNLDPAARKQAVDLLQGYRGNGKAVLITSHDLFDVERICTRIVLLRKGKVAVQGTMDELRNQLGVGHDLRIALSQPLPAALGEELAVRFGARPLDERELLVPAENVEPGVLVRELVEQGLNVDRVEERRVTLEDLYTSIVKEDEER
jgi:ABC-2 type transport system ATP-binding protein